MYKQAFKNQTSDLTSSDFKSPMSGKVDVRISGTIGAASLFLLLNNSAYGQAKVDLQVTDTNQAFPIKVNTDETFQFQLSGSDASTNISVFYDY